MQHQLQGDYNSASPDHSPEMNGVNHARHPGSSSNPHALGLTHVGMPHSMHSDLDTDQTTGMNSGVAPTNVSQG